MSKEEKCITALFEDENLSTLSEDFKTKASVIFENAVVTQLTEEKEVLREEYKKKLDEEVKKVEEDLEEKIDSYLNYIAEEWVKDNQLAVENGIQVEIAENFLGGMKQLFEESYVEVPDNKVDLVEEMISDLDSSKKETNRTMNENIKLTKEIKALHKSIIITECTDGMVDTQKDKVQDLAEMIDYIDEKQFKTRIDEMISTYFGKNAKSINEEHKPNHVVEKDHDDMMKNYVEALTLSATL